MLAIVPVLKERICDPPLEGLEVSFGVIMDAYDDTEVVALPVGPEGGIECRASTVVGEDTCEDSGVIVVSKRVEILGTEIGVFSLVGGSFWDSGQLLQLSMPVAMWQCCSLPRSLAS